MIQRPGCCIAYVAQDLNASTHSKCSTSISPHYLRQQFFTLHLRRGFSTNSASIPRRTCDFNDQMGQKTDTQSLLSAVDSEKSPAWKPGGFRKFPYFGFGALLAYLASRSRFSPDIQSNVANMTAQLPQQWFSSCWTVTNKLRIHGLTHLIPTYPSSPSS